MWRRVDQLDPVVALGGGAALGAVLWWAAAVAAPGLAVWAGVALLAAAVVLAFSGQAVATPEPPMAKPEPPDGVGDHVASDVAGVRVESAAAMPEPVADPRATVPRPPGIEGLETYRFTVVTVDERGAVRARHEAEALSFAEDLGDGVRLDLTFVPGGRFVMGSHQDEPNHERNEAPRHEVNVGPFYLGRFAVTQAQWRAVARWRKVERDLDADPSRFKGADHPVERVSWHDAVEFCRRLSVRTGRAYGLPSEAQWEYACRAGTETPFHFGPTITPGLVNYDGNYPYGAAAKGQYREQTTAVGHFGVANAFGLFDLHGNVWEWCQDVWHDDYQGAPEDGSAWMTGGNANRRVLRGGAWDYKARNCRSAVRNWGEPDGRDDTVGFRVVCSVSRTP